MIRRTLPEGVGMLKRVGKISGIGLLVLVGLIAIACVVL